MRISLSRFSLVPRSFFYFIPIQTGGELIAATSILNKASAPYGLGGIFTGSGLTAMQWALNIFSILALNIVIWGFFSIRRRRPLRSLAFTYIYIFDVFLSLGFTIFFIVNWFAIGFKASNNLPEGYGSNNNGTLPNPAGVESNKSTTVGQELATTVVFTTLTLLMRFYFMMVIIGYARHLVRKCGLRSNNGEPSNTLASRIQYLLIRPFEKFWTGMTANGGHHGPYEPLETRRLTTDIEDKF